MNLRRWTILAILSLLVGGLGYRWYQQSRAAVASFVPNDALLVMDSHELLTNSDPAGLSIQQLPLFSTAVQRLKRLLYSATDSAQVQALLAQKTIRYSVHPLTRSAFEIIFCVPVGTPADQGFLQRLQQPDPNRFRILSRQYAGQTIYELRDLRNQSYGSFLLYRDHLIGSPSALLLENVARHLSQFFRTSTGVDFPESAANLANLYVNADVLGQLLSNPAANASLLRTFLPQTLTLQFRRSDSPTHWLGFATDPITNRQDVANLFAGQTPHRIRNGALIPQRTATLYHLGISDPARFGQSLTTLLRASDNARLRSRLSRITSLLPNLYNALSGDVILCRFESSNTAIGQVLILEGTNVQQLSNAIQGVAYRLGGGAKSAARPVAARPYLGHQLLPLPVDELPATLFTNLFAGFSQTWMTQHGRCVVLANSEENLQAWIQQMNSHTVWATDERLSALLTQTLRPAHFTSFTRLPRSGSSFLNQWPTPWQNLLGPEPFERVENLAYQATYGQDRILSTVILGRTSRQADTTLLGRVLLRKRIPFNASLIASPVVAGRLSDPGAQIWAQNSAQQFVLLTTDKDKIVQDTTDGPIRSNVVAVDWRNNGQLQYLFMTSRSLYVADLGLKRVQLQRIALPAGIETSYLALLSGNRQQSSIVALMAHRDGSIYALDRQQQRINRLFTSPKKEPLQLPFQVIDQRGQLAVLGLQTDGFLHYWEGGATQTINREATRFPLKLAINSEDARDSVRFAGPALFLPASNQIVTVNANGELITVGSNGLIISRKQLYRPLRDGTFRLFPDAEQTGYILLRTTDADVAVLDAQGNRRFELRGLKPDQTHVQYHRLGAGVEILAVKSGNFTTLYDLSGNRIGNRPIPSDFPVTLQFDDASNELYIVSSIQKAVQLFSIRIR
ncbi:hypothetical protein J2I47_05235 [Fibrella sp. HMF5335]|uniref:Uncharacterized protein n=1 Tax=Fibrella rubiginis TaxID=2817060 RepID=A0A939GG88_9BACT|nr:hypothetical protein [Fibrella rubiginis]MBO0935942.1 hypothetical protein [Fibrella rubiginis]